MQRPTTTICHANAKGTGTALRLELHPASTDSDGSILATIAPQKAQPPQKVQQPHVASFEWNNSISVRLCLMDLAKILQVFRGNYESIDDGKGLYHRTIINGCTVVRLYHRIEPIGGYVLDVSHKPNDGEIVRLVFLMTYDEAFALAEAIDHAMLYVAFGVPFAE